VALAPRLAVVAGAILLLLDPGLPMLQAPHLTVREAPGLHALGDALLLMHVALQFRRDAGRERTVRKRH
jgi:hypothetical protein